MDWQGLFESHGVDYVTRGPNTKRGEISIRCPFCGEDDPSHHMGISLTNEVWGCHRSAAHRGKNPTKLVAAVLGVTFRAAALIISQYDRPDPESLTEALAALEGTPATPIADPEPLVMPAQFKPIMPTGLTAKFYRYLANRHFDDVDKLSVFYDLRCAMVGRWKDRIIIPFYQNTELIGWTARAIGPVQNAPRYLSTGAAVKETVLNYDEIKRGGEILIITEGPFDAMKLDFYGRDLDVCSTCIFGTSMTLSQVAILNKVAKKFDHTVVLFDPDAIDASFGAKDWLLNGNLVVGSLPPDIEDPGSMTRAQCLKYLRGLKASAYE
jgi:hypothetical protein